MHTYITEWSILGFPGSKKNLGYQIFFLGLGSHEFFYYYFAIPSLCFKQLFNSEYVGLVSVASLVYFTACVFPTIVIMTSQPTVVAQPVVVHVLCEWCGDMLWEAHWLVVQHNTAK